MLTTATFETAKHYWSQVSLMSAALYQVPGPLHYLTLQRL